MAERGKAAAVIQARMGSSRLPGKVLLTACGKPLLLHMLDRMQLCREVDRIIVATTTNPADDVIVRLVEEVGYEVFRGSENDVLDRYYQAATAYDIDPVVRVTSDCPLIEPDVVDRVVRTFRDGNYDYVSTNHPATFPDGLDTETFSYEALKIAWSEAKAPHEREHVSPFIWDQPRRFRVGNVVNEVDLSQRERWTLDYPEDYAFVKAVYEELYIPGGFFGMREILALLERRPDIAAMNSRYAGVNWYAKHWEALRTKETLHTHMEGGA
ncbi:MAG TPA: glycosyltransferase family protein [Candidatus Thermoplasmatota archaeon]|nr:glycosyltransferase family protein [Candidatus Thermoplasmatota archaeon]